MHLFQTLWWWIEVHTGIVNEAGPYYGAFSGVVSDIGEITLVIGAISGLIMLYKKINCHVDERPIGGKNCHRIGRHHVAGGKYIVCKHHHPEMGKDHVISAHIIAKAHKNHLKQYHANVL